MTKKSEIPKRYTIEVLERKRVTVFARTSDEAIKHVKTHSTGRIVEISIIDEVIDDDRCPIS